MKPMTVRDLKEALACLPDEDDDLPVKFAYTTSDYWRTLVAADITQLEEDQRVVWSDYHRMDQIVESDDDNATRVIILS